MSMEKCNRHRVVVIWRHVKICAMGFGVVDPRAGRCLVLIEILCVLLAAAAAVIAVVGRLESRLIKIARAISYRRLIPGDDDDDGVW